MSNSTEKANEHKIISGDTAMLARRYGGALYELADDNKQLDEVAADLRVLRNLIEASPEFRAIANHPRLTRTQLVATVQKVTAVTNFNALTGNFMALVAKNRRLGIMTAIIDAFLAELAAHRGEFSADVRIARPLTPAQEEQLAAKLQEIAGGKVHLNVRQDDSLIGGLTVKLGSRLIDASIRTKLQRLERQLKSGQNTAEKAA